MMRIYTAQMRMPVSDEIDITIKSASTAVGRALAPTWPMVNHFKQGVIDGPEYTEMYLALIRGRYANMETRDAITDMLLIADSVTLKCYCPAYTFCHRLIAKYVLMKIGEAIGVDVCDGGEITGLSRR